MFGSFVGSFPFFNDAVAGTVVQVKAGGGQVFLLKLVNKTGALAYLQVFSKLAANVTLGTTVADFCIPLAANESVTIPFPMPLDPSGGKTAPSASTAGISIAGTTTATGSTGAAISVFAAVG